MSGFILKLIAVITMLIDHVGYVFFPHIAVFRMIGRIAFPLYALLLTEGFYYTKSRPKYALRLAAFAILSEIPFDLAFSGVPFYFASQNVFFSLLLGLLCLCCMEYMSDIGYNGIVSCLLPVLLFSSIAFMIRCDYSYYAVILVTVLYLCRDNKSWLNIGFAACVVFYLLKSVLPAIISKGAMPSLTYIAVNSSELLALPFLAAYNGKRGFDSQILKYSFYAFYPIHLLLLAVIYFAI